jgi:hypothetical protein
MSRYEVGKEKSLFIMWFLFVMYWFASLNVVVDEIFRYTQSRFFLHMKLRAD